MGDLECSGSARKADVPALHMPMHPRMNAFSAQPNARRRASLAPREYDIAQFEVDHDLPAGRLRRWLSRRLDSRAYMIYLDSRTHSWCVSLPDGRLLDQDLPDMRSHF